MIKAPAIPMTVIRSGVAQAGRWAASHCRAGRSKGPRRMSFPRVCSLISPIVSLPHYILYWQAVKIIGPDWEGHRPLAGIVTNKIFSHMQDIFRIEHQFLVPVRVRLHLNWFREQEVVFTIGMSDCGTYNHRHTGFQCHEDVVDGYGSWATEKVGAVVGTIIRAVKTGYDHSACL